MRHECYFCHIRTIEKLIDKFKPDEKVAENFIFSVHKLIESNWELSNPKTATEIHRMARIHLNNTIVDIGKLRRPCHIFAVDAEADDHQVIRMLSAFTLRQRRKSIKEPSR